MGAKVRDRGSQRLRPLAHLEIPVTECVCVLCSLTACRCLEQKQSAESRPVNCDALASHLWLSLVSVCLSISTSLSTLVHSTLLETELMTSRLQHSMSTHIQQLPESTQTSVAVFVSHCTHHTFCCLFSVACCYAIHAINWILQPFPGSSSSFQEIKFVCEHTGKCHRYYFI